MARDPKIDPQPGDILTKESKVQLLKREVIRRDGHYVWFDSYGTRKQCWISTWMEWARKATVTKAA